MVWPILANPFVAQIHLIVLCCWCLVWIVVVCVFLVCVCVIVCFVVGVVCCCGFVWCLLLLVVCGCGSCWWCGYWFGTTLRLTPFPADPPSTRPPPPDPPPPDSAQNFALFSVSHHQFRSVFSLTVVSSRGFLERPAGLMDKASASGAGDSRFES